MSDEEDYAVFDEEDIEGTVSWAVRTAGLLLMMHNKVDTLNMEDAEEVVETLQGFHEVIDDMIDTMPDVLDDVAVRVADAAMRDVIEEEQQVEQFLKEIEDL